MKTKTIRILSAFVLLVLLPPTAVLGLVTMAVAGEVSNIGMPHQGAVEMLAGKSITYWFISLAAIAITSWTWIFKWMVSQLEKQRDAHQSTTNKLLDYMEKDHTEMVKATQSVTIALHESSLTHKQLVNMLANAQIEVIKDEQR